jgi:hypothetical protein
MNNTIRDLFYSLGQRIVDYLPNLLAGILLVGLGWLFGWLVKRLTIRICMLFRVDRLLGRFRWGAGLLKADIRYGFFGTIGNVAYFIVFLVFLNAALDSMRLTVLSNLLQKGVLFFPKLFTASLIFGFGWLIASWVAVYWKKVLFREEFPWPTIVARILKSVLLLFFSAMALTELDIAREVVIIGFTVAIVTLGLLVIVLTSLGGRSWLGKLLETLAQK